MGKKKHMKIRAFSIITSLLMFFTLLTPGMVAAESNGKIHHSENNYLTTAKEKLSSRLLDDFKQKDKVTFIIKFKEKADTIKVVKDAKASAKKSSFTDYKSKLIQHSAVVSELKTVAIESQQNVMHYLDQETKKGNVENVSPYFIVNGIAVTGTREVAKNVATFQEVEKVLKNETRQLFTPIDSETNDIKKPSSDVTNVEWNVERVKAPQVWDMGISGSGAVIASIDSGVQWDHPALKEKYRGYNVSTSEVDHNFNWFDATAGQDVPYDDHGHGTHTVGTMVGSEPDGSNQIGVAPGAKWIAVKAFTKDRGTDEDLLAAAEWILAPTDAEGNTRIDMAPDVVNNSWGGGPGLDEWYRDVVIQWRNANIFPEFSVGNIATGNPGGPGSAVSPANYPESFATGATDIGDVVARFSLRGPSPYGEIKPDISAPGQVIRSSIPGNGYIENSGTSMAGPAVSSVAALLRSVDANLTVDEMEQILISTAIPLTDEAYPETPNNAYGYGLVDAYSAVTAVHEGVGTVAGRVTKNGEAADGVSSLLPLSAQVSILERGRSVNTNPNDGAYSLNYAGGKYTILAEAYGYYTNDQLVNIERNETTNVDFTLDEIPLATISGTIKNEVTNEVIEGATLLLIEDANITPVKTDAEGRYDLTAYEGTYTLKITARGYNSTAVEIVIDGDNSNKNFELKPFYSHTEGEIGYDDGTGEGGSWFHEAGNGWSVKMSLAEGKDRAMVTGGKFLFSNRGKDQFQVEILDASGPGGAPGKKIAGPIDATAVKNGEWTVVDLRDEGIIVEGDFYMVYIQTLASADAPGLQQDKNGPFTDRSWEMYSGYWYQLESNFLTGNKMIRALVDYEMDRPVVDDLKPSADQSVQPGDEVDVSFRSDSVGGEASFIVQLPSQDKATPQSSASNPMEEVEPGVYKGTWTVPKNLSLEGAVIEVELIEADGNKVTQEAKGKLFISSEQIDRTSGEDRYLTAIEVSKKGWEKSDTVVIARGDDFADALTGVPLAHKLNAPILLTQSNKLDEETVAEIKRLSAKKAIILGGASAISDSVTKELEKAGLKVERIAGANRFETASEIATKVAPNGADKVVVANGMDFPDALSVASHAAKAGHPILLIEANKLPKETQNAIENLKASQTIVVGGTTVVSAKVAKELPKATRLAGADRYKTNITIAKHFDVDSNHLYVATGKTYADALTGAVLAAKNDSAILLVHDRVPEVVTTYITDENVKRVTIFGGEAAVSSKVADDLKKLIE